MVALNNVFFYVTQMVTGDSLLIRAFAYILLSLSVYSVNSNMTGHFYSFYAIKLIVCTSKRCIES